ncbi:hypothetical protein IFT84_17620 [Rhizobium sp. CFBP 8762]|uniref:hypothetical protein n=1 Tax=Rhizobium sp. CFBP 8762 TaxID=2775279 RepID=UPI00177F127E|nr:hypothetical protein [Rhizobium sp. CFBP 8762]MBD8556330.1 hypothetical protein [Rhizobium sp. CFBP 8762]
METINAINNIPDVFDIFTTNVKLAAVLSVGPSAVSEMKRRNSIPVEYWPTLVDAAREIGGNDLTIEKLAIISAEAARQRSASKVSA